MLRLEGRVVSGLANFGQWIDRLSSFYEQKTGTKLYPGTLNVHCRRNTLCPRT
jgi:CTP-dependent riboflavin kinase